MILEDLLLLLLVAVCIIGIGLGLTSFLVFLELKKINNLIENQNRYLFGQEDDEDDDPADWWKK